MSADDQQIREIVREELTDALEHVDDERIAELAAAANGDDSETILNRLSRRNLLKAAGAGVAGGLIGSSTAQADGENFANATGSLGTDSQPLQDINVDVLDADVVDARRLNGEYRVSDAAELQNAISSASFGDVVRIRPGATIALSNTLNIPAGVSLIGSGVSRRENRIKKEFNGDLATYSDFVNIKNVVFDANGSNGFSGSGVVPESVSNRNCTFREVTVADSAKANIVLNETFLSLFDSVRTIGGTDGLRVNGDNHSPHNHFTKCRFTGASRFGINIRYPFEHVTFDGCLIDRNGKAGIGASQPNNGLISPSIDNTIIEQNDGPGVLADSTGTERVSLELSGRAQILDNNINTPSGVTTPAGDIHAENGQRLRVISDPTTAIGSVRRKNSDGLRATSRFFGAVGEVELPDTDVINHNKREEVFLKKDVNVTEDQVALSTEGNSDATVFMIFFRVSSTVGTDGDLRMTIDNNTSTSYQTVFQDGSKSTSTDGVTLYSTSRTSAHAAGVIRVRQAGNNRAGFIGSVAAGQFDRVDATFNSGGFENAVWPPASIEFNASQGAGSYKFHDIVFYKSNYAA